MPIRKSAKTRIAALRTPRLKLPALPPRNPVTRALLGKTLSVGTGKHEKSNKAKRQGAKQNLRKELARGTPSL